MTDVKIPHIEFPEGKVIEGAVYEKVIRLTLHNRNTYRGEYDASEDWEICSYGRTLKEAIDDMILRYHGSDIYVDGHDIESVVRIKFDEEYWYSPESESECLHVEGFPMKPIMSCGDVERAIKEHPRYIELVEEEKRLEAERKAAEEAEQKQRDKEMRKAAKIQKKKDDIAKLHELAAMYPGEIPGVTV